VIEPDFGQTPEWLAFELDLAADQVALLRMTEEDYRQASFLDQRILGPASEIRRRDWSTLAAAVPKDARRDAQYIFHVGNVGSTLVSRLLGEIGDVLALREPLLLRSFAERLGPVAPSPWPEAEAEARLDVLTAWLSRTFRPGQRVIVKATSFTGEIAWRLVPAQSRALFLFATPQHYVENILAGENSRRTLQVLSPNRLERLRSRCPGLELDLGRLSEARKAALGWACEMSALEQSAARLPAGTVRWADFDRFLANPAGHFAAIAGYLGHPVDAPQAETICTGPLMHRYSKALEYEYSPELRREILAEARWRHGRAIEDALVWLDDLAGRYPAVAQAIRRSQGN
jgi:hypothetical protein